MSACDAGTLVERSLDDGAFAGPTWVIAAGKASTAMAAVAERAIGGRLRGGVVIGPDQAAAVGPLERIAGGHPVPTEASERAGRRALEIVGAAPPTDRLLFLLSGGASSLMAVPASGLSLADKQAVTGALLGAGADIHSLNCVRKHLSAIKGGQLAAAASARSVTLALSDVVGDDLSVIASGPTVADASTFADAWAVLERSGIPFSGFPSSAVLHLRRGMDGQLSDTPKPGDPRLIAAEARVIGGRHNAMRGAAGAATSLGYDTFVLDEAVVGEAREAGPRAFDEALRVAGAARSKPACVVASGETTVRVAGSGRGGRNQELALSLVGRLAGLEAAAVASIGTDGVDGPTDAAGAMADSQSAVRARRAALQPDAFLTNNDAYAFFAALGDLIKTGPTGTNVGDLQIFLLA